ncbi:MAG: acyltransferase [Ruminococcus sp.]|uniref:acyltransferase n=1 Tax=Ruminococcus sp. TaxID=41978 RepID=UPI0025E8B3E0|nr:acyltransferase [Ruminococcus sp.]MCR4794037.1 acyltransferase [Ruminococcus sp.]
MNNRILYLSRLKALACIAVTVLHTFLAANMYSRDLSTQGAMMAVRNCMMWAVPCFVMASGALLLDTKRVLTLEKLFGKYILRMAVALIVFSVLFAVFDGILITPKNAGGIFSDSLNAIFFGTGWMHMWYIYLLFALYLLLPVYKIISENATAGQLRYMLLIYTVFACFLPFIETIAGKKLPFYICIYTVYPLYFFLGHALHTGIIKLPKKASGLMLVICLGIISMLTVHAYSNSANEPETSGKMISLLGVYSFPLYVVASVGTFGFLRKTKNQPVPVLDKIATELDNCSFGIYLLHMAVLRYIFLYMKFNPFEHGGTITIIGICLLTLVISYVITKLLKFVPYVNKLI